MRVHPRRVISVICPLLFALALGSCVGPGGAPLGPSEARRTPTGVRGTPRVQGLTERGDSPSVTTATSVPMPTDTPEPIPEGIGFELPYPIPAGCAVTPFEGPYVWRGYPAYWIVGSGIRAGIASGLFFDGDNGNKVMLQTDQRVPLDSFEFTGDQLDGYSALPELEVKYRVGIAEYVSGISFPAPGCWHIHVEAGSERGTATKTLDATVYVYPISCYPTDKSATPGSEELCRMP